MIRHSVQIAVSIILIVVAVRQTFQLFRHRNDLALGALTAGLISLALAKTLGMRDFALPWLQSRLGHWAIVTTNLWFIAGSCCFALFFPLADGDIPYKLRLRRARLELAIFAFIALGGMSIIVTVYSVGSLPPSPARYRYMPSVILDILWSGYPIVIATLGVMRALRYRQSVEHVWLRRSVSLVIVGAVGQGIVVCGVSLIKTAVRMVSDSGSPALFSVLSAAYRVGLWGGQASFALGLVLPALAGVCVRCATTVDSRQQRRYRNDMLYLWRTLAEAFPFIVFRSDAEPELPDFTRCTAEIADGLSRLAPYYHHGPISSFDIGVADPATAAEVVAASLQASTRDRADAWQSTRMAADPPYPRLEPDLSGWRQRARWMCGVSQELRGRECCRYVEDAAINS